VSEERDIISNVVIPEIQRIFGDNQLLGNKQQIELEAIRWETHAWPDVGDDAQDVINKEIGDYDILVGIMWKRYGTPTKRAGSGTGEEFERAYDYFKAYQKPKIMFYFRTAPFYTTTPSELAQFQKVVKFRGKLEELGVLFWEYNSPLQFERNVREHLIRQIRHWIKPTKAPSKSLTKKSAKSKAKRSKTVSKSTTHAAPSASTARIFLSYSRQDLKRIMPIYSLLKDAGYQPWLDVEALVPGQDWFYEMEKAIKESSVFLVFLSSNSVNKKGYIQKEARLAFEKAETLPSGRIFLIPVRLEPVEPPEWLDQYQWIDYFAEGGPDRLMFAIKTAVEQQRKRGS
jgi:hypothetical protein